MSAEQCELLQQLSSHVAYQCLIAAKCVICMLGACGICYQWRKQGVRFLVHDNTKVLFKFYYALNLFLAFACAFFYIFELIRLRFDCVVVQFRMILLTKGMAICSGVSAHNTIMIVSFERLYSALYPGRFEKQSNTKLTSCIALAVIIITWTFVMFSLSNEFTLFGDRIVAFLEDRIAANAHSFFRVVVLVSISNALSPAIFCLDLYLNFIRKPIYASDSLSIAYQRKENRRVILIILPIEITETLLGLSTTCALLVREKFQLIDFSMPIERLFFLECFTFTMFFPLILSIIIEFRVARRKREPVTTADDEVKATKDHFASLRLAWQ